MRNNKENKRSVEGNKLVPHHIQRHCNAIHKKRGNESDTPKTCLCSEAIQSNHGMHLSRAQHHIPSPNSHSTRALPLTFPSTLLHTHYCGGRIGNLATSASRFTSCVSLRNSPRGHLPRREAHRRRRSREPRGSESRWHTAVYQPCIQRQVSYTVQPLTQWEEAFPGEAHRGILVAYQLEDLAYPVGIRVGDEHMPSGAQPWLVQHLYFVSISSKPYTTLGAPLITTRLDTMSTRHSVETGYSIRSKTHLHPAACLYPLQRPFLVQPTTRSGRPSRSVEVLQQ
jgi:hypothetical protein